VVPIVYYVPGGQLAPNVVAAAVRAVDSARKPDSHFTSAFDLADFDANAANHHTYC